MELKGKIHEISVEIVVSEKFKKKEIIIEYAENPTYLEYIKMEVANDKISILDNCKVGDNIEAFFNLRGRAWTDKTGKTSYFNSLVLWRITASGTNNTPVMQPADVSSDSDLDALPF